MNTTELLGFLRLAKWEESEKLEWKESSRDLKAIVKTAAAFANASGGYIICGVNDRGEVAGQEISDATLREITQSIIANTDERLIVSVEKLNLNSRQIVLITVLESPLKPHLAYGKAYKRSASSNIALSQAEYRQMLSEKQNGLGADRDLLNNVTIDDLDLELIQKFVEIANERRNSNISTFKDPLDILTTLELAHNGVITKGAVLLFGKSPQKIIPAAEIRAACFKDASKNVFLDQEIIGGTLFQQFDQAIGFIKKHILLGTDTSKEGFRSTTEFPIVALQEMIANALIHRDYHDEASTYLNIILRESIEVNNPGALPAPKITPELMHQGHPSIPRNRRLARVFYLAGVIEQWGMGANRIIQACKQASLKPVVWKSENATVSVKIEK